MAQAQIFEGTSEDIARLLQDGRFAGQNVRLIVEPVTDALEEPEDYCDTLPTPPNTVRNRAHLDELLMAGINSPGHVMTEQDRINIDKAIEERLALRKRI